ncbi:MAG: DUF2195 family protein [Cellvibrionaceae bacterium]
MAAQKYSVTIICLLLFSCISAVRSESLSINNKLSQCISIEKSITYDKTVAFINGQLLVNKPISECGCKSALGSYRVFTKKENYRYFILEAKVSFLKSSALYLPIAADKGLISNQEIEIDISCARPD